MSHFNRVFAVGSILILSVFTLSTTAKAVVLSPNVANQAPVIGGNSSYPGGDYNTGQIDYATQNVTDGQNASPDNNTGSITEGSGDGSYWLGRQGQSTGYFVIDLGQPFLIAQIDLFNTSNGAALDRGTGQFTVTASNSVTNLGGTLGFKLTPGTEVALASGILAPETNSPTTVVDQPFVSSNSSTYFQYIRFDALSMATGATNGMGLNEIRVFAAPEPTCLALLALTPLTMLRRKRHA